MVNFNVEISKYANFTNAFTGSIKSTEWIHLSDGQIYSLDNQYAAIDENSSKIKTKIDRSEFKCFILIFQKLEEINI